MYSKGGYLQDDISRKAWIRRRIIEFYKIDETRYQEYDIDYLVNNSLASVFMGIKWLKINLKKLFLGEKDKLGKYLVFKDSSFKSLGPGRAYSIVGIFNHGDIVDVFEVDGEWARVSKWSKKNIYEYNTPVHHDGNGYVAEWVSCGDIMIDGLKKPGTLIDDGTSIELIGSINED